MAELWTKQRIDTLRTLVSDLVGEKAGATAGITRKAFVYLAGDLLELIDEFSRIKKLEIPKKEPKPGGRSS